MTSKDVGVGKANQTAEKPKGEAKRVCLQRRV